MRRQAENAKWTVDLHRRPEIGGPRHSAVRTRDRGGVWCPRRSMPVPRLAQVDERPCVAGRQRKGLLDVDVRASLEGRRDAARSALPGACQTCTMSGRASASRASTDGNARQAAKRAEHLRPAQSSGRARRPHSEGTARRFERPQVMMGPSGPRR
jgi:hypothetical protein